MRTTMVTVAAHSSASPLRDSSPIRDLDATLTRPTRPATCDTPAPPSGRGHGVMAHAQWAVGTKDQRRAAGRYRWRCHGDGRLQGVGGGRDRCGE